MPSRAVPPMTPAAEMVEGQFLGVTAPREKARFIVLLLPFERTTSYKKGTEHGPARLLDGSFGVELWDEEIGSQTYLSGIHTEPAFDCSPPAKLLFPKIKERVRELLNFKSVLFSVGGEHSLSQALIPPFIERYPDLSILHFDAHADMRSEYEGSPFNHACAMHPISRRCKVVQVGIRSVAEEEAHLLNTGNVTTFYRHEHRDMGKLLPKVLEALTGTVYISIDLDGFDPSVIPGVGTPQPGGFDWFEGLELFRRVIEKKKVVGVDVMELCPLQDTVNSEIAAAKLIYRLMGYIARK
ncbi:MAG: agmatinase [Elusimicrobia bacterium]|nr:agmatinase [Elusimicrobiota bacterium]